MIENKQFTGNNNIKVIKGLLKNKNALISIFITLIILCVFVFIANTTLPFITVSENGITGNSFLEMISLLGGGGLGSASLFAIGISPYITSQIIFQILSSELVPPIYRMIKHDGERGRKRVES
jgi:preprotein translocase subunit SecY